MKLALLLLLAAPNPIAWKLNAGPAAPVKPGATFAVTLVAQIDSGWHLYWMKQVEDGPIATRIGLAEGQPFQMAGPVKAPAPDLVHDPNFNMEVGYYEGETAFTLPVRVAASAPPGPHQLTVTATYQTCNDKVCLPPKVVRLTVPLTVKR